MIVEASKTQIAEDGGGGGGGGGEEEEEEVEVIGFST